MNANSLETVGERVQAYLEEALSLQSLSAWLLSKTASFADASRQSHDARLWARACNLIALYGDSALSEDEVRAALRDWLAEYPRVLAHAATPR